MSTRKFRYHAATWAVSTLAVLAANVMAYAAIRAFRDEADVPAAIFAVLAVMWAVDAQHTIDEARGSHG